MLLVRVVQLTIAAKLEIRPMMLAYEIQRMDKFHKLFSPNFSSTPLEDAQEFLDRCYERLRNFGLTEFNGFGFTIFQMQRFAKKWSKTYEVGRPARSPPLTWAQFSQFSQIS